jgi:hypothetical protein
VVLVVGQFLALKHEAETRHVTCAQHGEQIEVANTVGAHDDGCGQSHLIGVDGDAGAKHQDCAIARLLRTSTRVSIAPQLHVAASELLLVEASVAVEQTRPVDVISLAPKTSPPV